MARLAAAAWAWCGPTVDIGFRVGKLLDAVPAFSETRIVGRSWFF